MSIFRDLRCGGREQSQVADAIAEANAHDGPVLLDFRVEAQGNVWPMVPAGASLTETVESREEIARLLGHPLPVNPEPAR